MKLKQFFRVISLMLAIVLLLQCLPLQTFAQTQTEATEENTEYMAPPEIEYVSQTQSEENELELSILGEDESLRTEDTKHFRLSDGSFVAVDYGTAVHFQDETGAWQDIVNTPVVTMDEAQGECFRIINGETAMLFAASTQDGNLFAVSSEDVSVSFSLPEMPLEMTASTSTLHPAAEAEITTVTETETEENPGQLRPEDFIPEGLRSQFLYEDVYPGVDFNYTVYGYTVKEEIIVKSFQESYCYEFLLNMDGLTAALEEDGSVSLKNDAQEIVYRIPAPYMTDSNGALNEDVSYTLTELDGDTILTVVADGDWIEDESRALPVSIDPTIVIQSNWANNDITATYVEEGLPTTSHDSYQTLYVGYSTYPVGNTLLKRQQIYMHVNKLPDIPAGSAVAHAELHMYQYEYMNVDMSKMNIALFEVTSEKPASYSTYSNWIRAMTWSNKAEIGLGNVIDYTTISSSTKLGHVSLEVTELASKWYETGENNRTFAIIPVETLNSDKCATAAFKAYGTTNPPLLMVFYRSNTGIEPYYTYQTMGVGNAGTAYIADATGQLKAVKGLVSYASTANPFALNLVYNSDYFSASEAASDTIQEKHRLNMLFGKGFTWDAIQTVEEVTISGNPYLLYHDGDGTDHYFYWDSDEAAYCDEDGLGLKIVKGTTSGSYTMSDKDNNTWTFNDGRLAEQADRSGNKIIYTGFKNEDGYWLTQIKQKNNSGSEITLATISYLSGTSYVSSVTDKAGRVYSFGYENGCLSTISLDGTLIAQYHYSGGRMTGMTDCESGYVLWFTWSNGKINQIKEWIGVRNSEGTWSYPDSGTVIKTKFTREKAEYRTAGQDNVMGNGDDIISCFLLDYADRTVCAYTMDPAWKLYGATNAAYSTTPGKTNNRTIKTGSSGALYGDALPDDSGETQANRNLLLNSSFSLEESGWYYGTNAARVSSGSGYAVQITPSPRDNIAGDPGVSSAWQYVNVNCSGETYFLSGWAIGNAVPDNVTDASVDIGNERNKSFGLRAILYYANGEKEYHYVPFCSDIDGENEWQYTSMTIVPKHDDWIIEKICVVVAYERNANVAIFDDIALVREVAQTMKYDEDGNLTSVTTTGLDEESISYQEGTNLISSYTGGSGTYTYNYDTQGRVTSVTDGTVTQSLSYTTDGNISRTKLSAGEMSLSTTAQYTADGNRLYSLKDTGGGEVWYYYADEMSEMMGSPTAVVTAKPGVESYTGAANAAYVTRGSVYDNMGRVTRNSLSTYSSGDNNGTSTVAKTVYLDYTYNKGRLSTVTRDGIGLDEQSYSFSYDDWGKPTEVKVGSRTLASYSYSSVNEQLTRQTYGNGQYVSYTYDKWGRVKTETWSDGRVLTYYYSGDSQISCIYDSKQGCYYLYEYDAIGRLINSKTVPTNNNKRATVTSSYTYDTNNRLTRWAYTSPLDDAYQTYTYDTNSGNSISDGMLTGMRMVNGDTIAYQYDALQRLLYRELNSGKEGGGLWEKFVYGANSSRVAEKINWVDDVNLTHHFKYTYDVNGNIVRVEDTKNSASVSYTYDIQGQLLTATHGDGREEAYTYDNAGNLLSFDNGTADHTYTYGDTQGWKDLLTAVDGETITYDGGGNPVSYYNGYRYSMEWSEGRKLTKLTYHPTYSSTNRVTTYQYDHNGTLIKRTDSSGSYVIFQMVDGKAVGETRYNASGTVTLYMRYTFDEQGSVVGISLWYPSQGAWTDFYFAKNLQGDVVAVYRESDKALVASYSYDSWGNILSKSGNLADINPFRYRSYYFDTESWFYYLQSRFYDPAIGRFINADVFVSTGQDALGYNMFAYCGNNPVNRSDYTGEAWGHWALAAGIVALAAAAVVVASGGVAAAALAVASVANGVAVSSTAVTVAAGVFVGSAYAFAASAYGALIESDSAAEFADYGESGLLSTVGGGMVGGAIAYGLEGHTCFVAGTAVKTENGNVPIEQITVGTLVWAWDEGTGDVSLKRVVETYENETYELVHVFVNGEEIVSTPTHPFYLPVKGWIQAGHLHTGDTLLLVNGEHVVIEKVQHEILGSPIKVYNFQVEDYHTYYVSGICVLVHNVCNKPTAPKEIGKRYIDSNDIDAHAFKQQAGGVPRSQISRYDIYQDTADNHSLWVGKKDGRDWRKTIYVFSDLVEKWVK